MGLYVQGHNNSSRDFRCRSIDDLEDIKDDGIKIDLGRDSVINPDDVQAILKQKRKDTSVYR